MRQRILIVIFAFMASLSVVNAQTKDSMIAKDKVECESNLIHFRFTKSVLDSGYMNNAASLRELDREPLMPMPQEVVVVEQEKSTEEPLVTVEPTVEEPLVTVEPTTEQPLVTVEPTTEEPLVSRVETIKRPLFALKTNLLELAAGVAGCNCRTYLQTQR